MMSFGWRPNQSCYENQAQVNKTACPSAAWWYVLLGLAVVAGASGGKK